MINRKIRREQEQWFTETLAELENRGARIQWTQTDHSAWLEFKIEGRIHVKDIQGESDE
jgi:hypothetical protein